MISYSFHPPIIHYQTIYPFFAKTLSNAMAASLPHGLQTAIVGRGQCYQFPLFPSRQDRQISRYAFSLGYSQSANTHRSLSSPGESCPSRHGGLSYTPHSVLKQSIRLLSSSSARLPPFPLLNMSNPYSTSSSNSSSNSTAHLLPLFRAC